MNDTQWTTDEVQGFASKLGSFYKQVVLPDQESIRDPKMTVKDVLAAAAKTLGAWVAGPAF